MNNMIAWISSFKDPKAPRYPHFGRPIVPIISKGDNVSVWGWMMYFISEFLQLILPWFVRNLESAIDIVIPLHVPCSLTSHPSIASVRLPPDPALSKWKWTCFCLVIFFSSNRRAQKPLKHKAMSEDNVWGKFQEWNFSSQQSKDMPPQEGIAEVLECHILKQRSLVNKDWEREKTYVVDYLISGVAVICASSLASLSLCCCSHRLAFFSFMRRPSVYSSSP